MCYDVNFTTKYELITAYLPDIIIDQNIKMDLLFQPHRQAQAHSPSPIVTFENANYHLTLMEWGVIADYMNTPELVKEKRASMCNARADKILDKKSYWNRIRKNRCLIPVSGIYEHRAVKGFKTNIPYHVNLKGEALTFIPALYANSKAAFTTSKQDIRTYSMVTRKANGIMAQIHNAKPEDPRMPLFLPFDLAQKWLLPDLTDIEIGEILNFEIPSDQLEYWPVFSVRSSKPRPDGKEKNEPFYFENLPALNV